MSADPRMTCFLTIAASDWQTPLPTRLLGLVLLRADAEGVATFEDGELARLLRRDDRREGLPDGPLWRGICRCVERGWLAPTDHETDPWRNVLVLGSTWVPTPTRVRDTYGSRVTVT